MCQEKPEFGRFGASYFQSQQCVIPMLEFCFGLLQSELCPWGSRSGPRMRVFFFMPFISSGVSTLFFLSTAVRQRLGQREGLVSDGLCSILGSKRAFCGDAGCRM